MNTIRFIHAWLATRERNDEGAAMVEYGMLVAFIAAIAVVGVKVLGVDLLALFNGINI